MLAPLITILGAGMAGLVAAARARELGAGVELFGEGRAPRRLHAALERRRSGGTASFDEFRRVSARMATRRSSGSIWERLDEALDWLEAVRPGGAARTTNPLTTGRRF